MFLVDFRSVQDTYHSTLMRGSTMVGTYGYMAPEQFRGQAVPATDLYGLGADSDGTKPFTRRDRISDYSRR